MGMEARICELFKNEDEYTILSKMKGKELEGLTYKPLFPYFEHLKKPGGAFRVLTDGYVTEGAGTGIVHQAPYHGEDDNRVCLAHGLIVKGPAQEVVCPLDASGRFTDSVTDFKGLYVKDADKQIIKHLKEKGRLVHAGTVKHSYAFCWRSQTPLLNMAVPSWFMKVQQMRERLLSHNEETYWVPENIRDNKFGNWLRDARDWNISRNRYWGTPIPVWISEDGEEQVCVGSIEELHKLSGVKLTDLHRENVDKVTIPSSRPGQPPLKRIPEVFDCWFESGSMPYAQSHYPFENKREFEDSFPADFIAEGADQTRGWFYTLLVISTALFDRPPFKNLIVNGLVLAVDGAKMSKSKKNYPDPMNVVNKFGADAVRLYLINSPVVKAENLKFKEQGVQAILKDVFLPWYNAYRFLFQNIEQFEKDQGEFIFKEENFGKSENIMDKWIISFTQSLLSFVAKEMAGYRLYTVIPRLVKFIDNLTNWYVRMNRKRLKGEGGVGDCRSALETLFGVVLTMARVMAPFTPFLTETMYQQLKKKCPQFKGPNFASVHYLMLPQAREDLIYEDVERAVARMQAIVDLGRVLRDRKTMPIKYPLPEVVVIHKDQQCLSDIRSLEKFILEELNVRSVTVSSDKASYGVTLRAEPDHKTLGFRLKGDFKAVMAEIKQLSDAQLTSFLEGEKLVLKGHDITMEDIRIMYSFTGDKSKELSEKYEADSQEDILVLLDTTPDQEMLDEGVAREVVNRVQKLRKAAGLKVDDQVTMMYTVSPEDHYLAGVISKFSDYIQTSSKTPLKLLTSAPKQSIKKESYDLKGAKLELTVTPGGAQVRGSTPPGGSSGPGCSPAAGWLNLVLLGAPAPSYVGSNQAGIILNDRSLDISALTEYAQDIFGLYNIKLELFKNAEKSQKLEKVQSGETVYVSRWNDQDAGSADSCNGFNCNFVNVDISGKVSSVLLENPRGKAVSNLTEALKNLAKVKKVKVYSASQKKNEVSVDKLAKLVGQTLYL